MYSPEKPMYTPVFTGFSTESFVSFLIENFRKLFNLFVQADEHAEFFESAQLAIPGKKGIFFIIFLFFFFNWLLFLGPTQNVSFLAKKLQS